MLENVTLADLAEGELPPEVTELADAQHHLFLDQPLTFMDTLTTQLKAWQ